MPLSQERLSPDPIDFHVGRRLRALRKRAGLSQQKLAESLSLTFQQIQKYERGANRVSASKLYLISQSLRCSVADFFEGLPSAGGMDAADPLAGQREAWAFVQSGEAPPLVQAWRALAPADRRALVRIARALAEPEPATPPLTLVRPEAPETTAQPNVGGPGEIRPTCRWEARR